VNHKKFFTIVAIATLLAVPLTSVGSQKVSIQTKSAIQNNIPQDPWKEFWNKLLEKISENEDFLHQVDLWIKLHYKYYPKLRTVVRDTDAQFPRGYEEKFEKLLAETQQLYREHGCPTGDGGKNDIIVRPVFPPFFLLTKWEIWLDHTVTQTLIPTVIYIGYAACVLIAMTLAMLPFTPGILMYLMAIAGMFVVPAIVDWIFSHDEYDCGIILRGFGIRLWLVCITGIEPQKSET